MANRSNTSLLLIEDEPLDVRLVRHSFAAAGFLGTIVVAGDGEEAMEYLEGADGLGHPNSPDLILMDMNLPGWTGLEILERIQGRPSLKRIPVIILTSLKVRKDFQRAHELGVKGYFIKPEGLDSWLEMAQALASVWLTGNRNQIQVPKTRFPDDPVVRG